MADQNFMDLASKTASGIAGTDYMMLVNNSEAYKALVNDVAEAILSKLTSKSFSGLETTAKNVIGALNELNSNIDSAAYERGARIPQGSNLNNYTDPGVYYVENNSDASTIQNYPTGISVGCRIEVRAGGSGWIHQRLYPNNNSDVYDRFTDSSHAFNTPWYRIQSTSVN